MLIKSGDVILNNEQESEQLALTIAKNIKPGDVLVFQGDLGSGKSFFCRHIIKSLCGNSTNVTSPTFNLLQIYEWQKCLIYHYDLYRLKDISEIYELGIEEAFTGHVCLIEWPELLEPILPKDTIHISIKIIDHTKRLVSIKN